jgi:hypothetical protein
MEKRPRSNEPRRFHVRWMLVSMVLLIDVAACSTSGSTTQTPPPSATAASDGGVADGNGDAIRCPFPLPINTPPAAVSCPSDCPPAGGEQIDDPKHCVRAVLVGCLLCPNGCGGAPEGPCYRNISDGRIVRVPSYAVHEHESEWVRCTAAEEQPFATLPPCN